MSAGQSFVSRLLRWQHIWAVAAIVGLLCINVIKDPGYLSITYSSNTGAFVGNLVDIARAAAPLLMIATGMCLVIATGGLDLYQSASWRSIPLVRRRRFEGKPDDPSGASRRENAGGCLTSRSSMASPAPRV
jgi:hypothetical protein